MKRIGIALFVFAAVCISVGLVGCSGGADENKPISDVQADAQKMDTAQLKEMATKYREAIMAKKTDVDKLMTKLKEVPIADAMGKEAQDIKKEMDTISTSIKALKERFDIYYNKLAEKGGDVSGLSI
jgi:outer membrane murein-binding lipoprotein Lpp